MICPNCSFENALDARYCFTCGARLEVKNVPPTFGEVYSRTSPTKPVNNASFYRETEQTDRYHFPINPYPANDTSANYLPSPGRMYENGNPQINIPPMNPVLLQGRQGYYPPAYAPPFPSYTIPKPGDKERNWLSVSGFICGILSIPCLVAALGGFFTGLAGLILAAKGLRSQHKGLSIAGIICGSIGIVFGILIFIVILTNGGDYAQYFLL